jgi:hypothetical protein
MNPITVNSLPEEFETEPSDTDVSESSDVAILFRTEANETDRVIAKDGYNDEFQIQVVNLKASRLIKLNELFWDSKLSVATLILLVLSTLVLVTVSALGALPYLIYSGDAPESIKQGICITRYIIYLIIFSSHWLYVSTDLILRYRLSIMRSMAISWSFIARQVLDNLFTLTYTILYAVKWISLVYLPSVCLGSSCTTVS